MLSLNNLGFAKSPNNPSQMHIDYGRHQKKEGSNQTAVAGTRREHVVYG